MTKEAGGANPARSFVGTVTLSVEHEGQKFEVEPLNVDETISNAGRTRDLEDIVLALPRTIATRDTVFIEAVIAGTTFRNGNAFERVHNVIALEVTA